MTDIQGFWPDAMLASLEYLKSCDFVMDVTGAFPATAEYTFIRAQVFYSGCVPLMFSCCPPVC